MYNRYIRTEDEEAAPQDVEYIPVDEYEEEEAAPASGPGPDRGHERGPGHGAGHGPGPRSVPQKEKRPASGLFKIPEISSETLIILGVALFLLCDSLDEASDKIKILIFLLVMGF